MRSSATTSLPTISDNDPWSTQASSSSANTKPKPKKIAPVRDAWDDDDGEDEEEEEPVDNTTLWQQAESKPPMPSIIFASSSSTSAPAAAVVQQQSIRILRRPGSSSPSASQNASADDGSRGYESFRDRQAAYDAARTRIFGNEPLNKPSNIVSPSSLKESYRAEERGGFRTLQSANETSELATSNSRADFEDGSIVYPHRDTLQTANNDTTSSSILRQPRGPPSSHQQQASIGFSSALNTKPVSQPRESDPPISQEPKVKGKVNGRRRGGKGRGG